jgi:hypothetical protein
LILQRKGYLIFKYSYTYAENNDRLGKGQADLRMIILVLLVNKTIFHAKYPSSSKGLSEGNIRKPQAIILTTLVVVSFDDD